MTLDAARAVADAVLYEGYLLYPYRASAAKNRSRWQFGVLGPPAAAAQAFAEAPDMSMQCLLAPGSEPAVTIHLRFLQLQAREVQRVEPNGSHTPVDALTVAGSAVLSWEEAVEREISVHPPLSGPAEFPIDVPGGEETEPLGHVGRIVRRRWPLTARLRTRVEPDGDLLRLTVAVANEHPEPVADKDAAARRSLLGAHLLVEAHNAAFLSLLDPPPAAALAAGRCRQHRCWPVLAGPEGTADLLLGAPIILYDNPRVAAESPGALFDSTEIDEILTLRVMTMTDDEKAEARATDPRAAAIVDRCDAMTAADLQQLHGARRDPDAPDLPWWDPAADGAVDPGSDVVVIDGVTVSQGSLVRVHPSRRADAQDLFFADRIARVTAVVHDVDGGVHVALVLVDDPAADLHDWYGRYFYFAPDELEPLPAEAGVDNLPRSWSCGWNKSGDDSQKSNQNSKIAESIAREENRSRESSASSPRRCPPRSPRSRPSSWSDPCPTSAATSRCARCEVSMTQTPGRHLDEEPQSERGPVGSRDTGSDQPSGGPADRPAGTADAEHDTSIKPDEPEHPGAPTLPSGS